MGKEKTMERLVSLFKEEQWGRIDPKDIGISKFKILNDLFNNIISEELLEEAYKLCNSHLTEFPDSIIASYLVASAGYHMNRIEDTVHFRKLIDLFLKNHKWAVVEIIAEKVLEYGENRYALKALATSLEKLGRNREATPVWESLLKIDRFDTEVAKKLAFAIIDEEPEKSIQYMKLSIEGFIKKGEYDSILELWNKLLSVSWNDINFFDRIERMLVDAKQEELAATLLKSLMQKYRDEENPTQSIEILKKILDYTPDDNNARKELIKFYEKKYSGHSQYGQFLKLSKLNDYKHPVKHAIQDFEKNIVFDKGNFVNHRSWGVGLITDIDSESIIIDFREKVGHKMSIMMALQSLVPINKDHIYAVEYEDPTMLQTLLKEDFGQFFDLLLKSYNGSITLGEIKKELSPKYIDSKNWSKWWSKARTEIKKNPHYGISPSQKDLIYLRDKPVTFAEELLNSFIAAEGFSNKLNIVIEFVNNVDSDEGAPVAQFFIDYFNEQLKEGSHTKEILSYFILKGFSKYIDPKKLKLDSIKDKIIDFIRESKELPMISIKISSYDYKKDLINLIEETREDWPEVVSEILFETPVRIHKYILNNLIRAHAYNNINYFIDRTITGAKQNPEIFIWVSKNLLYNIWDYDWLDYSRELLILTYFRLLNELKKIEPAGNRLKNTAVEALFEDDSKILKDIIESNSVSFLGKIYDLFRNVSYIEPSNTDKFRNLIKLKYPDFTVTDKSLAADEWKIDIEKLIVSQEGYNKMQAELNRMVTVEMVNLSKDLATTSDVSGDVRENVDYNALVEKQTVLKMAINRLDNEIKKAEILNPDTIKTDNVNIGSKVTFEDIQKGDKNYYSILGPWDADFEKRILSYRSPIAKILLGKKIDDQVDLKIGDETKKIKITNIEKYSASEH